MKKMTPSGFTDAQQAASYFAEKEVLLESIVKGLESIESATTTENEGIKEAIKSFRDTLKNQMSHPEELSRKEVMYQLGKALAAAWTGDTQTLGSLRCTPNLKSENWNNPADFEWTREKGFQINRNKAVLGEPMGNMATNDQFLINPIYEEVIMSDVAKKSVMMNLVTNRPMAGPSIFIPERDNGGLVLNWLTNYGQQIQASKPNAPVRKELKAYTLAG
ncbi:MAG TPA: phage major capsid protein, partial [Treponemataceae bacterium]|nr:phage major capsid protein [Treponemataceae bacterium]